MPTYMKMCAIGHSMPRSQGRGRREMLFEFMELE